MLACDGIGFINPLTSDACQSGLSGLTYNLRNVLSRVRGFESPRIRHYVSIIFMKKKIIVEKEKFDAVLRALIESKPIRRKSIKTSGKRGSKAPLFQK